MNSENNSKRGFEWTAEERNSIKPMQRQLQKKYDLVNSLLKGLRDSLPEYAQLASEYGNPFLESVKELLKLDSRNRGRRWQDIPLNSISEKLQKVNYLYEEYIKNFLSRKDFQAALVEYNRDIKKKNIEIIKTNNEQINKLIKSNLEYYEKVKHSGILDGEIKLFQDAAFLIAETILSFSPLTPNDEQTIKMWITIQAISIASGTSPAALSFVKENIFSIDHPLNLLREVYLLILEESIIKNNDTVLRNNNVNYFISANNQLAGLHGVIFNTIKYRLERLMYPNKAVQIAELDLSFHGKDFKNLLD